MNSCDEFSHSLTYPWSPNCLKFQRFNAIWGSKWCKIAEFQKTSIKMKNFKTFYEAWTASRLKEITQPPSDGILVISKVMQGQGNVRLVVPTHVATENVSDEESSLETSTLGSITTSSYDILNISYASSLINTSHSTNTSPVETHQYLWTSWVQETLPNCN